MKYLFYLSTLGFFISTLFLLRSHLDQGGEERHIYVHPPQKQLKHFSLGYTETLSNSLWLRWLQDTSICGKNLLKRSQFDKKYHIKISEVKLRGSFKYLEKDVCEKGWSYLMVDAITDLSPRFKLAYHAGANHLSIVGDDHEGARLILHKSLKYFYESWNLHFLLGYLYLYEFQDPKKASYYLFEAAEKGGPPWIYSLASQIFEKTGQVRLGLSVLKTYLKVIQDKKRKKEILKRISALEDMISEDF